MTPLLLQIGVSLLLFAAVFFVVWAVFGYPVPSEPPVHRRIAASLGLTQRVTVFENPVLAPLMTLALQLAQRLRAPNLRGAIRRDLDASGNPSSYSVDEYIAICFISAAVLALISALLVLALAGGFELFVVVLMAAAGFMAPILALRGAARARVTRISKQLPYSLDLIALMMASGSTFTEAVDTIIRDDPDDDLNQELRIVRAEIDFGTQRATALANMAERIPLETLRSIVGAVNQAESLGTPLSTILKNQASMLRTHRSVRAEKLSASASLRILVPSMLILMAVVLVVFGPMILRYGREGVL